jgi:hypothetical protein
MKGGTSMAKLLQAVVKYGPRIDLMSTVGLKDISDDIARRTGLNKSEIMSMLQEVGEVILDFTRDGRGVKFPGVGTFTPSIDRDGCLSVNFRLEQALKDGLNAKDFFRGEIKNRENLKIGNEKLKLLWDAEHPDDPLEL